MLTKKDPVVTYRDRVQYRINSDDQLIRQLDVRQAEISEWHRKIRYVTEHFHILNDWQPDFILGLGGYSHPSERQRDKLRVVIQKIELAMTVSSRRRASR